MKKICQVFLTQMFNQKLKLETKKNEKSLKDTWQIYFQALKQQKAYVYFYSDKIEPAVVRRTFLNPVENISDLIYSLIKEIGPDVKIYNLPEGPQTIPFLKY